MEYNDDLVYLVSGANIAGYMEYAEKIAVVDDEDLTRNLIYWINEFDALCALTECKLNYFDFIAKRLAHRYGYQDS